MSLLGWFVIAVLSFLGSVGYLSFKIVPQGMKYTVERFGRYRKTLQPGLGVIVPFADLISHRIDIREQVLDIPAQEVITQDNARISVDAVAYYRVFDAEKAAYEVLDYAGAVKHIVIANVRAGMGSLPLEKLLSSRDDLGRAMLEIAAKETEGWGVEITNVRITDISPAKGLQEAMAKELISQREKKALITTAEGEKEAMLRRAEGARDSEILRAEGAKRATELEAEATHTAELLRAQARLEGAEFDSKARELLAKAEANAIHWNSQAMLKGDGQAVNYFVAQQYIKALEKMASADNQRLIMMPLEASNLIGALGGISEIFKPHPNAPQMPPFFSGSDGPPYPSPNPKPHSNDKHTHETHQHDPHEHGIHTHGEGGHDAAKPENSAKSDSNPKPESSDKS